MTDLLDQIALINSAGNEEDAFARFCGIMAGYGYERIAYSLLTDHPSLLLSKQHGLVSSYPEHWMKFYREQSYLQRDPVVTGLLLRRAPFFWDELRCDEKISRQNLRILDEGCESGVKDGIGIPHFGAGSEIVGIGLARTNSEGGRDMDFLADAYLLSAMFHQKFRSFLLQPLVIQLNERQRDILSWAAEGKTDEEIGMILGLSVNTVRWHWKKIGDKLDAKGRLYCISKAFMLGLIEPLNISAYRKW